MVRKFACLLAIVAAPAVAENNIVEEIGDWEVRTAVDPMSDATTYTVEAQGANGEIAYYCSPDRRVTLVVLSNNFLGSGPRDQEVQFRVDDRPSRTEAWRYGRDLVGAPEKQFSNEIADGKSVLVRVRSFNHSSYDITVPIDGARAAITRFYELCGKKNPLK